MVSPSRLRAIAAGVALAAAVPGSSAAQTAAAAGGHVHYVAPPRPAAQSSPSGALAPRLQNLGAHTFTVTTTSRQAQRFMNQGLNLAYAFNHAEARRAFREAARLDPNLAMAYWGQALVLGPNINAVMEPNEEPQAFELVQQAVALKPRASMRERAYIDALAQRYSGKADDRRPRDEAYAAAMCASCTSGIPTTLTPRCCMSNRSWTCGRGATGSATARPTSTPRTSSA
jgi:hypothetical protein